MIYLLIMPNFWIYLVLLAFYFVGCVSDSFFFISGSTFRVFRIQIEIFG